MEVNAPFFHDVFEEIFEAIILQLKIRFRKRFVHNSSPTLVLSSTYKIQIKRNVYFTKIPI